MAAAVGRVCAGVGGVGAGCRGGLRGVRVQLLQCLAWECGGGMWLLLLLLLLLVRLLWLWLWPRLLRWLGLLRLRMLLWLP